jgi:HEAT repeat protein
MSNFDLIQLLKSEKEEERKTAAEALGKLENPNAIPALLEALEKTESFTEAITIVQALGRLGDNRTVAALFSLVERSGQWQQGLFGSHVVRQLRGQIAEVLGRIADKDALIEKLHHPDEGLRRVAAEALGNIRII